MSGCLCGASAPRSRTIRSRSGRRFMTSMAASARISLTGTTSRAPSGACPGARGAFVPPLFLLLFAASSVCGQDLPDGKGKEVVARHCTGCHAFRAGGGYTPKGWATVMRMMTNHGLVMSPDEGATATQYLSRNFPEKPKPDGAVVQGPASVSMTAWQGPPPRIPPHHPLAGGDRSLLDTGAQDQWARRTPPLAG